MDILREVNHKQKIIRAGVDAKVEVIIDGQVVVTQKIDADGQDRNIDKTLVFGELFTKPEDFCIGALLGTDKAVSEFKEKNF